MDAWDARMTRRPEPEPLLERLETIWQFIAPSRRVLDCGLYRTATGIEVRAGYGLDDPLFTRVYPDIESARAKAAELREAVAVKGGFTEVPLQSPA